MHVGSSPEVLLQLLRKARHRPGWCRRRTSLKAQMMKELLRPMTSGDALTGTDDSDSGSGSGAGAGSTGALGEFAS